VILVDSSVVIGFLRGAESASITMFAALDREPMGFALPSVVCQEVLQGARDAREWKLLEEYLAVQPRLDARDPWATHRGAARLYFECRRRGVTVRSSIDCWIAQLALEHDATLLHDDDDFEALARVTRLKASRG